LESLNDSAIDLVLISDWFAAQLLRLAGHTPNLRTQSDGQRLQAGQTYDFDFDSMNFEPGEAFNSDQIKFLRLLFSDNLPQTIGKVKGSGQLAAQLQATLRLMLQNFVRL
jgi:hypothetical protein